MLAQTSEWMSSNHRSSAHRYQRLGNRYFENMNAEEELPGEHSDSHKKLAVMLTTVYQAVIAGWTMLKYGIRMLGVSN